MTANPEVDAYVDRSDAWPEVLTALRPILRERGLTEALKWAKPCYCHDGSNIAILQEMKDFVALMFFTGALLDDPAGVLELQGPNSRSARRICLRSTDDVTRLATTIADYVDQAIAIDEAGLELGPAPELVLVDELQARLTADDALRRAFEALTPGRQREYHLHISGAKKAATRESRIDRCTPRILDGKGLRDR